MPYETGLVAALAPIYLRGEAYRQDKAAAEAVAEFQKILDHRGTDPFSPLYPLVHLGQARAWTLAGDLDRSRAAYSAFLAIWADADEDIPLLRARPDGDGRGAIGNRLRSLRPSQKKICMMFA